MGVLAKPIPFGDYFLLEKLNTGGMAEVFKAKTFGAEGFERIVAVKKILPSIAEDKEFISMFINEAKLAVQLNHANIAQINDLGNINGDYYIAMEYVPGHDLRVIFDRCVRMNKKLDIGCVCYIMSKVCEGLDYAHNKKNANGEPMNIIHRDISPQNIMIGYDGEVKLIDFGIAKATNQSNATQVGILKGKFSYMSPEQVSGKANIDRRSDIFAIGIVLFEMLTLKRLFLGASDFETLEKIRKVEVSPPTLYNSAIPEELEDIVMKALEKDVSQRFQTAQELQEALQRFMFRQNMYYTAKELSEFCQEMFAQEIALEQKKTEFYKELTRDVLMQSKKSESDDETAFYDKPNMPKMTGVNYDVVSAQPAKKQAIYAELDDFEPPKDDDIVYSSKASNGHGGDPVAAAAPAKKENISAIINAPVSPNKKAPVPRKSQAMLEPVAPVEAVAKGRETVLTTPVKKRNRRTVAITTVTVLILTIIALVVFAIIRPKDTRDGQLQFVLTPADVRVRLDINNVAGEEGILGPINVSALSTINDTHYRITADGYEPIEGAIKANKNKIEVPIHLQPLDNSILTILADVDSAEVSVDGKKIEGNRRFEVKNMTQGQHTIVVEKDGYKKLEQVIDFKAGEPMKIKADLKPEFATLVLKTQPYEAQYQLKNLRTGAISSGRTTLDGVTIADLPADDTFEITIYDGNNKIQREWKPNVSEPNEREYRSFKTEFDPNAVAVVAPEPEPTQVAAAQPAPRPAPRVEKKQAEPKPAAKPAQAEPKPAAKPAQAESKPAPAAPKPVADTGAPGKFLLNSKPPSNVYINGKDYGATPKQIEMPPGDYIIRFVNAENNLNVEKKVTLKAGEKKKVFHP